MGGVVSWLRGTDSLAVSRKALAEVAAVIKQRSSQLATYRERHRGLVSLLAKVFAVLEVLLCVGLWLYPKPADMVKRAQLYAPLVVWPLLCWLVKRALDSFFGWRIRRDEAALEVAFASQRTLLKQIESDPAFQEKLELLKLYGKDVPEYTAPSVDAPTASAVKRRPPPASGDGMVAKPAPVAAPPQPAQRAVQDAAPATPARVAGPTTPSRTYTQPVDRPTPGSAARTPRSKAAAPPGSGTFWSWLVDLAVGEGLDMSVQMHCEACDNSWLEDSRVAVAGASIQCSLCKQPVLVSLAAAGAKKKAE